VRLGEDNDDIDIDLGDTQKKYKKPCNTAGSQEIPHPSTDAAYTGLSSQSGRDTELCRDDGRKMKVIGLMTLK
jgi:hypothetical protein